MIHGISTRVGQSGAPIILKDQGGLKIVGIHKGGRGKNVNPSRALVATENAGRIVTPELITTLRREADKMKAVPFK